jgi:hypothetical protein
MTRPLLLFHDRLLSWPPARRSWLLASSASILRQALYNYIKISKVDINTKKKLC